MKNAEPWDDNSLGELMRFVAPSLWPATTVPDVLKSTRRAPGWPPDVFAMCAAVLHATGAHRRLFSDNGIGANPVADPTSWPDTAEEMGKSWKTAINNRDYKSFDKENDDRPLASQLNANPAQLRSRASAIDQWWRQLIDLGQMPLVDVFAHDDLPALLVQIIAVADEASAGIGISRFERDLTFLKVVESAMTRNKNKSCCADISLSRASVLPKQHTPTKGITLRSLTHHLSYLPSNGVTVEWIGQLDNRSSTSNADTEVNLLLAPWPVGLSRSNFRSYPSNYAGDFDLFSYWPTENPVNGDGDLGSDPLESYLDKAHALALNHVNKLHVLVMPEMSVTQEQYLKTVEPWAIKKRLGVVAGICDRQDDGDRSLHYNRCVLQTAGLSKVSERWIGKDVTLSKSGTHHHLRAVRVVQSKHHRWLLDRPQIVQYGLSGRIPAYIDKQYWEDICIEENNLKLVTVLGWLTCGALVCEDLARQDNVSESIRAIGPNLIIAILMDGPQIRQRWPAKYASVLADDPGSSVLTLTSLAMTRLSRPNPGQVDRSGVIALWHDAQHGEVEVELHGKQNAAVLSLIRHDTEELTADGRSDGGAAYQAVFAGYNGLEIY
jgi:hypothetical protein